MGHQSADRYSFILFHKLIINTAVIYTMQKPLRNIFFASCPMSSLQITEPWYSPCSLMKLWSVQALVITVDIVITLGALCSLGFGVSTRMFGCHFSSVLWPKRKSSFTSLWSSVFADNIPYPPRGRTRPLKGGGGAGEMWSHPLFKPLPPGSFPTWPTTAGVLLTCPQNSEEVPLWAGNPHAFHSVSLSFLLNGVHSSYPYFSWHAFHIHCCFWALTSLRSLFQLHPPCLDPFLLRYILLHTYRFHCIVIIPHTQRPLHFTKYFIYVISVLSLFFFRYEKNFIWENEGMKQNCTEIYFPLLSQFS